MRFHLFFAAALVSAAFQMTAQQPDTIADNVADTAFHNDSLGMMIAEEPDTVSFFVADSLPIINPDTLNISDSLREVMEMEFEEQNSGRAIVDQSSVLEIINTAGDIPYFADVVTNIDISEFKKYGYAPDYIPRYPDSVYMQRIEALRRNTTIPLSYNKHVRQFIDLYAVSKREMTSRVIGLSYVYFPLFEEKLDKYNMPLELKYLAIVESALNPTAGSHVGAKGLWQFMYGTGKVYKLNVTSLVDDRYDPLKSTEAACQHMLDLYNVYHDWFLVLAAYNSGAGNVNKAIRRAGGVKDYWAIWPFLPRETRGYVPAFIAVNYVMNYAPEHNIIPKDPGMMLSGTDTVVVNDLLHFDQLHEMLGVPMSDLKFFNPQYTKQIIPADKNKTYVLRLPSKYAEEFVAKEAELYAFKTKAGIEHDKLQEKIKQVSDRSVHVVRSGENLGSIAKKYHVSVNQLKRWNNLKSNTIYPKQKLIVYNSGAPMAQAGNAKPEARSTTPTTHVVKKGENLGLIAKKYNTTIANLKRWNNLNSNTIHPGQKLKVYPPDRSVSASAPQTTTYVVKSGDTLEKIARRHKMSIAELKRLNNLKSDRINVGQKLKVKK